MDAVPSGGVPPDVALPLDVSLPEGIGAVVVDVSFPEGIVVVDVSLPVCSAVADPSTVNVAVVLAPVPSVTIISWSPAVASAGMFAVVENVPALSVVALPASRLEPSKLKVSAWLGAKPLPSMVTWSPAAPLLGVTPARGASVGGAVDVSFSGGVVGVVDVSLPEGVVSFPDGDGGNVGIVSLPVCSGVPGVSSEGASGVAPSSSSPTANTPSTVILTVPSSCLSWLTFISLAVNPVPSMVTFALESAVGDMFTDDEKLLSPVVVVVVCSAAPCSGWGAVVVICAAALLAINAGTATALKIARPTMVASIVYFFWLNMYVQAIFTHAVKLRDSADRCFQHLRRAVSRSSALVS